MRSFAGFTLIELSIVLVIIGLVAGGVFVGRDLIEAARIRSQISQIERYDTAANTFRSKYNYLPGDLPSVQATSLGFAARAGDYGNGDGDGYVDGRYDDTYPTLGGETVFFWTDLSAAQLIAGSFTYDMDDLVAAAQNEIPLYLPSATIGRGYVMVYGHGEKKTSGTPAPSENNYQLIEFTGNMADVLPGLVRIYGGPLTPVQALAFDQKTDDGMPTSDRVHLVLGRGIGAILPTAPNVSIPNYVDAFGSFLPPANDCAIEGPPIAYDASNPDKANLAYCSLRIKAAF